MVLADRITPEDGFCISLMLNEVESEKIDLSKLREEIKERYGQWELKTISNQSAHCNRSIIRHGIVKRVEFKNCDLLIEVHESSSDEKIWAPQMLRQVGFPFSDQLLQV